MIAYSLKILIQFLSSFPYVVSKSLALKPYFIIGYLHLFTLGFMSILLLLILLQLNKIAVKSTIGMGTFLTGIFLMETVLFLQGFLLMIGVQGIGYYQVLLLGSSALIVIGLLWIFVNQFPKK